VLETLSAQRGQKQKGEKYMKWFKFNALPIFLFVGLAANVFLVCSSLAEEQKTKVQTWDTSNSPNKELIKQLDSTDPNIRFKAIMKLGLARDSAAIEPLARLRDDELWQIREVVGWALGKIKDPRSVEILIEGLNMKKFASYAAIALGEIGDAKAVEPLIRVLKGPTGDDKDIIGAAVESLGMLKDSRAVEPLLSLLKNKNVYTSRRDITVEVDKETGKPKMSQTLKGTAIYKAALNSIVSIADKRAVGALIKFIESEPDEVIRKAAQETLEKLR
jgi:HEAT repeat protein